MKVGVPKEIKADEYRVGMMPVGAETLSKAGHQVFVETQAGVASGFTDEMYKAAGAVILPAMGFQALELAEVSVAMKERLAKLRAWSRCTNSVLILKLSAQRS